MGKFAMHYGAYHNHCRTLCGHRGWLGFLTTAIAHVTCKKCLRKLNKPATDEGGGD